MLFVKKKKKKKRKMCSALGQLSVSFLYERKQWRQLPRTKKKKEDFAALMLCRGPVCTPLIDRCWLNTWRSHAHNRSGTRWFERRPYWKMDPQQVPPPHTVLKHFFPFLIRSTNTSNIKRIPLRFILTKRNTLNRKKWIKRSSFSLGNTSTHKQEA